MFLCTSRQYRHYSGDRHYSTTLATLVSPICARAERFHRRSIGQPVLFSRHYRGATTVLYNSSSGEDPPPTRKRSVLSYPFHVVFSTSHLPRNIFALLLQRRPYRTYLQIRDRIAGAAPPPLPPLATTAHDYTIFARRKIRFGIYFPRRLTRIGMCAHTTLTTRRFMQSSFEQETKTSPGGRGGLELSKVNLSVICMPPKPKKGIPVEGKVPYP